MKNLISLLFCILMPLSVVANPPIIWGPSGTAALLTSSLSFSPSASTTFILSGAIDPSAVATNGPKGSLYSSTNGSLYLKNDAGTTTNWSIISGGAIVTGNLTAAGTDGMVVTGGTNAVIGAGTSLAQHVSDTTHNGYLTSTDWNTFNGKGAGSVTSVALTVPTFLSVAGSPVTTSGTLAISLSGTALPLANGGTAVTSVTTAPAATAFAGWDANKNLSANNHLEGYATTVTAAGTTTLAVGDAYQQYFTGSTTQTVKMPVTSTLVLGQNYLITNLSSGNVTVQSSGANSIQVLAANTQLNLTVVSTAGTGTASWSWTYGTLTGGGSAITALTGDLTATGPGSVAGTLATVNGNTGAFGDSSHIPTITLNGKGLATAASSTASVSAPAASIFAGWDANSNLSANNLIDGYATTVTAAGTTALVVGSKYQQYFTGSTTQVVTLPVTSTLVLGQQYNIVNSSTGVVTVNSSGSNLVVAIAPSTSAIITCILTSGTGAASWSTIGGGTPLTTKGDTLIYNTAPARKAVGLDNQSLAADSSATDGLTYKWPRGKNYLTNGDIESNATTGWTLGTIGTLTNGLPTGSPTFGSGASGNLSIAATNTTPIEGTYSLSYVSSAATTAGNMVASSAMAIDIGDRARMVTFQVGYQAITNASNMNFSGTSSNSYALAAWDVTNSSWLSCTGNFSMVQSSGAAVAALPCQTNSTTASVRVMVYNANATAGAATLYLDTMAFGPSAIPGNGLAGTDPVAYTPVFTGFGSPTGINFKSWRVGKYLYVMGTFTNGTPTATEGRITIGFNGTSANVTSASTLPTLSRVGDWADTSASSATDFRHRVILIETSKTYMTIGAESSAAGGNLVKQNGNAVSATGATISVDGVFEIEGWSSNTAQSSDTDTRVAAARITGLNGVTTTTTGGVIKYFTTAFDTHGVYSASTGLYTAPVAGYYRVTNGVNNTSAANSGAYTYVGVNGNTEVARLTTASIASGTYSGSALVKVNAGDTIGIYSSVNTLALADGTSYAYLMIERLSGPAVVQATESVNGRYYAATATLTGSFSKITYSTKDFDSHGAYSTGTLTIPVSGKYQFNAFMQLSAVTAAIGANQSISIFKNGVQMDQTNYVNTGLDSGNGIALQISDIVGCLAGDLITVQALTATTTPTMTVSNFANVFSWARVGN